jgi:hypothetical protein
MISKVLQKEMESKKPTAIADRHDYAKRLVVWTGNPDLTISS